MRELAVTTVATPLWGIYAIIAGGFVLAMLQWWAMVDVVARRTRWGWRAAVWFSFPLGMIAWLAYGRRRERGGQVV